MQAFLSLVLALLSCSIPIAITLSMLAVMIEVERTSHLQLSSSSTIRHNNSLQCLLFVCTCLSHVFFDCMDLFARSNRAVQLRVTVLN